MGSSSSGELEKQEGGDQLQGETIRKQLAVGVKNIQWSYAIFWSISSKQSPAPGVLEWGEGYYNGEIKTRKTVQAAAAAADHQLIRSAEEEEEEELGLERSEQIRELFKSLSDHDHHHHSVAVAAAAEKNNIYPQQEQQQEQEAAATRRPSIALSPEDLTDAEWYFLVCMSFVFHFGQGLPGRALANNRTIWLCNAHCSDSLTFSRSLLAKSASIQTVVCFPYLGGVIELGTTDKVLEDHKIIVQMKSSLQEMSYPKLPRISRKQQDSAFTNLDHDHEILDNSFDPVVDFEEVNIWSPQNTSIGIEQYQQAEESLLVEGRNFGTSQALSWQFMDDGISDCVDNNCSSSSDSISQNLVMIPAKDAKKASFDFRGDDSHYQGVLSTLFKNTRALSLGPQLRDQSDYEGESGFAAWRKGGLSGKQKHDHGGASQVLLKKALFEVPKMHRRCLINSPGDKERMDSLWRPESDEMDASNALAEKRRRARMNQRFSILGSMVPSTGKTDKVSILDGTIAYLKELERRVEELEAGKKGEERRARTRKKPHGVVGRTSDSYGDNEITSRKKPLLTKRKASALSGSENGNGAVSKDDGVSVSITEKNVSIEIRCRWREHLLFQIMDVTSTLHLDSYSVQSSNTDGVLSLTIGSKLKSSKEASAGMIMQAIQRIIEKG